MRKDNKNRKLEYKEIIFLLSSLLYLLLIFSKDCYAVTSYSWVASGEDIKINNKVFKMYISTENNLLVKKDSAFITIRNNTCENIEEINICVLNVTEVSGKIKAYIRTYYNTTALSLSRVFNKTQAHVGEKILVNVTINNTANHSIPFEYSDELPEGLILANKSTGFYASGILSANQIVEYNYEVFALKESTYKTRAKLQYEFYGNKEILYSTLQTLLVKQFINASFHFNTTEIFIGEETRVDINITNLVNESRVEIELIIPESLELVNSNISCYKNNLCRINTSIPENSTMSFFVNIRGKRFGSSQILIIAKNIFEEVRLTKNIIVKSIEPSIFFSNSLVFESDEEVVIKAYMQNPSTKVTLKNINITILNDLIGKENMIIREIPPMQRVLIINKTITTPKENSRKIYKIKINSNYFTEYGDFLKYEFTRDIVVEPIKEITITHKYKNKIEGYEETFFEVSVKNNRKANLTVTLEEKCPEEILKSNQSIKKTILVYAGETVSAYSYLIKAPNLNETKEYYIQTTATYNYSDEIRMISKTSKLEVVPRSIKLSLSHNLPSFNYKGNFFSYDLQITNSFKEPIYNILIFIPQHEEFDFERTRFYIKKLNPEEQAILKTMIRPKTSGNLKFGPSRIIFEDIYGNTFEQNTTVLKISINESYIPGEAIIAKKNCFLNDSQAFAVLRVENIGDKKAEIRIKDSENSYFYLEPGIQKFITYELSPAKEDYESGYLIVEKSEISYNILGKEYTAYSNKCLLNLSIDKKINDSEASLISDKAKQNRTMQEVSAEENKSKRDFNKKSNFFKEVINSIIKLFYVRRVK